MAKSKFFKGAVSSLVGPGEEAPRKPKVLGVDIKPVRQQKIILEQMGASAEPSYFWVLNFLRHPNGLGYEVEKTSDIFSSSEMSTFFGAAEERKQRQQERVSQYLATIGSMTKSVFQMVRELRIMDERLEYYEKSLKGDEASEITLKNIWTNIVEGGVESGTSVFGLARKAGFVTLPDLFFKINPKKGSAGVDREVNALKEQGINSRVRSVLKHKLMEYYTWKEKTYQELKWGKNFRLKALNQHYQTMKMYIRWVKPFLKNIQKLEMYQSAAPELITAFETNMIQIELFAFKKTFEMYTERGMVEREFTESIPCIRVLFKFVALPEMAFQKEFQRAAVHAGRTEITIQGYVLSPQDIEDYRKSKELEDLEILKYVDASLEALGDELKKYLVESGEMTEEQLGLKKKEPKPAYIKDIIHPFASIFKGFSEMFGGLRFGPPGAKKLSYYEREQESAAAQVVSEHVYTLYDVFKKTHDMLSW
ncbi:MAG: hypothetical protein QXR60_05455 [Candidatus Nanoarchaeia archaeon]